MGQSESQIEAQWQYKANPTPFSSEKGNWEPYEPFDNYMLERAYYTKQNEVDLGEYIVSLKDKLQRRKDNHFKQRPIRRNKDYFEPNEEVEGSQDEKERAKRYLGIEKPRTFNNVFGGLQDYLGFFEYRNPDIKNFVSKFNEIEASNDLEQLNQRILPIILDGIKIEAKSIPKIKDKKQLLKHEKYEKQLFSLLQGEVTSFQQFYSKILKVYTMEGFLYKNLNCYLRDENWIQLDSLLPYAYCLCKAFFSHELISSAGKRELGNIDQDGTIILYRGAQFDQETLDCYIPEVIKNFCWNGMTSTSTNRRVAEKFMYRNIPMEKIPIMFVIEIPVSLADAKNTTWMDIKSFSAVPREDEVVIAPGSAFELVRVFKDRKGVEINLRLMTTVTKLAHQGQILHGVMHSNMMKDGEYKIVCLEGKELLDAIVHLKGNQIVEDLEFCICIFDKDALANLVKTLKSMLKLKRLAFVSSKSDNEVHFSPVFEELKHIPLHTFEICDEKMTDSSLYFLAKGIYHFTSLTSLKLDFSHCSKITNEGLKKLGSEGIKYLTKLTYLNLNFSSCSSITDEGIKSLSYEGIRFLTLLTSLSLNFTRCENIKDEGLRNLSSQGIKYLTSLTSLNLNFHNNSSSITDEGVKNLACEGIKHLTSLISLKLNFDFCQQITDEGLRSLTCEGIKHLTSLTSLSLNFSDCSKITDQGLNHLSCEGIQCLKSLQSLNLNLFWCKITDEGIKNLRSQGIQHLTSLTSLNLNFSHCSKITDTGLKDLISQGIKSLTQLTSLNLDFSACSSITDKGEKILERELALYKRSSIEEDNSENIIRFTREYHQQNLVSEKKQVDDPFSRLDQVVNSDFWKKLQTYKDHFAHNWQKHFLCDLQIADFVTSFPIKKQFNNLANQQFTSLTLITSLKLKFTDSSEVTSSETTNMVCQIVQHLPLLTSLDLDFSDCSKITDEDLKNLSSQGIKNLTSLALLNLNFSHCEKITDEGLKDLTSQGIRYLTSLTSLNLNFDCCREITDEGLRSLSCEGIRNLTLLTSLSLDFSRCSNITDEGLKILSCQGIKYLISLRSLKIWFACCKQITGESLSILCHQAIKHLISLASLDLYFLGSPRITGSASSNFKRILNYFGFQPLKA